MIELRWRFGEGAKYGELQYRQEKPIEPSLASGHYNTINPHKMAWSEWKTVPEVHEEHLRSKGGGGAASFSQRTRLQTLISELIKLAGEMT